mmetsp:Transcript_9890/g.26860  ORF Transcript_9890/g.26860 Transcript_9890/m.26860 type:complete len:479 (+) Transcript_9890:2866-4302(+)|eukprot:CAMPEP_0202344642 /NCGR_PEP_ID=MMETSP1126-20121109/4235_1 /ASSEMBLY_ACC=CAM_ASM_000457 /TAXON_ID=3047 /ORGANISM="Dunaliella tertiolecta, Strain CCMP1320" /LENGTH=478 /DNA_ID=CAMNT_0048935859 /DNA_START=4520 /DNA_END=5956 /DNA_ORIENTATION=+
MAGKRLEKIRLYEDRLADRQAAEKQEKLFSIQAHWTERQGEKLQQQAVGKRFEALKARREADLNHRRQMLAEKLHAEAAALQGELMSTRETPEQRRAKLAARARELAAKREQERQALADKLYNQAFMENCDVLRETNSKRILFRTLEERNAQIEQSMAYKILDEEEKRMFNEMNEQQALKAEQRHQDDKRRIRERNEEMVKLLDQQVVLKEQRRAEEAAAKKQEVAELQALWARMAEEQAAMDAADAERMRKLASELQEFNKLRQTEMSERERLERELDLRILQEALAKEAAQEEAEAAQRAKRTEQIRAYRHQLASMMEKDAEDQGVRDAMIQAVADAQQRKQDEEWAMRERARQQLMAEVDAIRQEQIRDKQARQLAALEEEMRYKMQIDKDGELLRADQEARAALQRKRALEQQLMVQTQMVARAHIKAAEEDDKLRALENARLGETAYMSKVKDTLKTTDAPQWYGRKKFNWYT